MSSPIAIKKHFDVHKRIDVNRQSYKTKQEGRLKEAAQMYEKQFLATMLKQMRKTVPKGGMFKETYAERIYKGQRDQQYVDAWAKQGGIGIGKLIYEQLHEKIFKPNGRAMQRAKGPLPVDNQKPLPIDKGGSKEPRFKILPTQGGSQTGAQFLFKENSLPGGALATTPVTAPWDGVLEEQLVSEQGLNVLRLNHGDGVRSVIHFPGSIEGVKQGQTVAAGQKLGDLLGSGAVLGWRVDQKS